MIKQEDRPRIRANQQQGPKAPLTFYRSKDKQLNSNSPFEKRKITPTGKIRRFFGGLLGAIILLALVGLLVYSLIVTPTPKIVLSSEIYHPASTYKDAAKKYLGSFQNRNKITLNEQAIVQSLQKQFPEISSGYIELPILAQTPIVHLNIASPSFILSSGARNYIVNSQGVAVAQINRASAISSSNLPIVTDSSGFKTKEGQQVMSAGSVQFITGLAAQLQHGKVPVKSITLPAQAEELDLQTSDRPYYTKFFMGADVLQQTGQFLATRHQFDTTNIQPSEYLDVRVAGKVFYK